jgi:hypothetical protein
MLKVNDRVFAGDLHTRGLQWTGTIVQIGGWFEDRQLDETTAVVAWDGHVKTPAALSDLRLLDQP